MMVIAASSPSHTQRIYLKSLRCLRVHRRFPQQTSSPPRTVGIIASVSLMFPMRLVPWSCEEAIRRRVGKEKGTRSWMTKMNRLEIITPCRHLIDSVLLSAARKAVTKRTMSEAFWSARLVLIQPPRVQAMAQFGNLLGASARRDHRLPLPCGAAILSPHLLPE